MYNKYLKHFKHKLLNRHFGGNHLKLLSFKSSLHCNIRVVTYLQFI